MPGLVPGIHVFAVCPHRKTWMAGTQACEARRSSNGYARP